MEHIKINCLHTIDTHWKKMVLTILIYSTINIGIVNNIGNKIPLIEFVLICINNSKYLIFFFYPFLIMIIYSFNYKNKYEIIVRHRKYLYYYITHIITLDICTVFFIGLHIVFSVIIGILFELPIKFEFNYDYLFFEASREFRSFFHNHLLLLVCSSLYILLCINVFDIIVFLATVKIGKKPATVISLLLYIAAILSSQSFYETNILFFSVDKYFLFFSIATSKNWFIIPTLSLIVFFMLLYILNRRWGINEV